MKQVVGAEDRKRREKMWTIKGKAVQTKKQRDKASGGLKTMTNTDIRFPAGFSPLPSISLGMETKFCWPFVYLETQ